MGLIVANTPAIEGGDPQVARVTFDAHVKFLAEAIKQACKGLAVKIFFHGGSTSKMMAGAIKRVITTAREEKLPPENVADRFKSIWGRITETREEEIVVLVDPTISEQVAERYYAERKKKLRHIKIPPGSAVLITEDGEVTILGTPTTN